MRLREALNAAAASLDGLSDSARLDAELLTAHALGTTREDMLLRHMDAPAPTGVDTLIARRRAGEPVAYITGRRAFWSIDLAVGPGVLIPRPDSETLIEAAVAHFTGAAPASILDLGTGPGTLLLAALAEWPDAQGLGVDASAIALDYAHDNAARLGMADRAVFRAGDWVDGVEGTFDLILCNPPYIAMDEQLPRDVADHEPREALFAGVDGLDDYRVLAPQLARLIAPGGMAAIEIGYRQAEAVAALFTGGDLAVRVARDLAGRDRAVILQQS